MSVNIPAPPTTESMRLEEAARIWGAVSVLLEQRGIDLLDILDGWQDHVAGLTPAEAADYLAAHHACFQVTSDRP